MDGEILSKMEKLIFLVSRLTGPGAAKPEGAPVSCSKAARVEIATAAFVARVKIENVIFCYCTWPLDLWANFGTIGLTGIIDLFDLFENLLCWPNLGLISILIFIDVVGLNKIGNKPFQLAPLVQLVCELRLSSDMKKKILKGYASWTQI